MALPDCRQSVVIRMRGINLLGFPVDSVPCFIYSRARQRVRMLSFRRKVDELGMLEPIGGEMETVVAKWLRSSTACARSSGTRRRS